MKQLKQVGLPIASILLICFYPCAFLFFQNAGEARAADMLPFFGIFLATAAAGLLVGAAILRNLARAAVLADLGTLVVIHFTLICNGIKRLLPGFHNVIFLGLTGLILLGLLVLFWRKKPNMTAVCGLVSLVFASLTAVNLVMALPTLISAATYHRPEAALDAQLPEMRFAGEKRNVYCMLFDEYGGSENLKHYFDYDNEDFFRELEARGFSVSRSSRNRESCWTVTLIPNLLNLDYVVTDDIPINSRLEWMEDPALYRLFRQNGYQVNLINQNGFLGEKGCRLLSKPQYGETISDYLYANSIFCQLPKVKRVIEERVLHRGQNGPMESLEDVSRALEGCWAQAQDKPTLTVSYFVSPHAPFLFDENGTALPPERQNDWTDPSLYLTKLQYTNEVILRAVDNIQREDPKAAILLLGDHGARTPGHLVNQYGGPWFDTEAEIPYMESVLCCAYVPEGSISVEGDSGINAQRRLLGVLFGVELPQLPEPKDYAIPPEYMPPPPGESAPPARGPGPKPPKEGNHG